MESLTSISCFRPGMLHQPYGICCGFLPHFALTGALGNKRRVKYQVWFAGLQGIHRITINLSNKAFSNLSAYEVQYSDRHCDEPDRDSSSFVIKQANPLDEHKTDSTTTN